MRDRWVPEGEGGSGREGGGGGSGRRERRGIPEGRGGGGASRKEGEEGRPGRGGVRRGVPEGGERGRGLSRPSPAERQNEKASVFFLTIGTRGTIRVCFFCVFFPRAICALLWFLAQNCCFYLARPFASLAAFLAWTCIFNLFSWLGTCKFANNDTHAFLETVNYARSIRVGNFPDEPASDRK